MYTLRTEAYDSPLKFTLYADKDGEEVLKMHCFMDSNGQLHGSYIVGKTDHELNLAMCRHLQSLGYTSITFEATPGQKKISRNAKIIGTNPLTGVKMCLVTFSELDL